MMGIVAGSLRAAGSLAWSDGLCARHDERPLFGPFEWPHEVQLRIARLLGNEARNDAEPVAEEAASATPADVEEASESVAAARLEGILLAAREIAHLVNNDLAVTVGTLDLLRARPDVPVPVLELLDQALAGLSAATSRVEQLQRVQRVVIRETPSGPSLDLDRSV